MPNVIDRKRSDQQVFACFYRRGPTTMNQIMKMPSCLLFILLLLLPLAVGKTTCTSAVTVEIGTTHAIPCQSSLSSVDFYWYKGQAGHNDLVCKLENGEKSVSERYQEYFNLSDLGSLIILKANLQHESLYTLVTFDPDGTPAEFSVLLNITVSPKPACIVISGCEPCKTCSLSVPRNTGSLECKVSESRPSVPLNWTIPSHEGISFIKHPLNEDRYLTTETWDTSMTLTYTITELCGVRQLLHCKAEDNYNILESNIASVEIRNDVCIDDGFGWESVLILICVGLLLLIFAAVVIWVIRRHTNCGGRKDENKVEKMPLLERKDEHVTKLLKELREVYRKYCFLRPLPWGEAIPIQSLYTESSCTVTDRNGKTTTVSDIITLTTKYIERERRVVFVGGFGYGKTTITQRILHQWIEEEDASFVLFYILLKDVKKEMTLSDIVLKYLLPESNQTSDIIDKVLRSTNCIVLLDGLDELGMCGNASDSNEGCVGNDSGNGLSIGALLNGKKTPAYNNVHVWVTSRQIDYVKQEFPLPYIAVKLNGFGHDQVDEYIKRTCKYYSMCRGKSGSGEGKDNNEVVNQEISGYEGDIFDWVKYFVDEYDIFCDFRDTPLLFVLIVHLLSDDFTKHTASACPKSPTMTELVSNIISCLESRYAQKKNCENLPREVPELERKLGKIAFENDIELDVRSREFWNTELGAESLDMALEVGLLKLSQKTTSNDMGGRALAFSSFTGIEFYHSFLQEYLAAMYVLTNLNLLDKLKTLLKKRNDESTNRVLQFMSGTRGSPVLKICEILSDMSKWNNFIDCTYEARDRKEFKELLEKAKSRTIHVSYLDKKYHRCALKTFCQNCLDLEIKLDKITFRSDCPIEYLTKINLPLCARMEFYETSFEEHMFVFVLQWFSKDSSISEVRFVNCKVPSRISSVFLQALSEISNKDLKVYREKWSKNAPSRIDKLNVKSGKWSRYTTGIPNI